MRLADFPPEEPKLTWRALAVALVVATALFLVTHR